MNNATARGICPKCGGALAAQTEGLCPRCLLAAVSVPTEAGQESNHKPEPPTLEELAGVVPQLEVLELLGHGGMGAVYKARQKPLDRVVALKVLPVAGGAEPTFAERFAREAKALARLNHPGIVTIHEFGQAGGLFYFIMEFVDGADLGQLLRAGRVSPREALAIVPQICDALQYAHDKGVVHRDIKPENILIDRRGRVKVADFGLAKLLGAAAEPAAATASDPVAALTQAGKIMGTPSYMAPEQLDHPEMVDHRADIYALGVVFYQMLTGQLPGKVCQPPSRRVRVDIRLDEVVLRALEKDPERRYAQAGALKTQIEQIAASPPTPRGEPKRIAGIFARASAWADAPAALGKTLIWHGLVVVAGLGLLLLALQVFLGYAEPLVAAQNMPLPAATRLVLGLAVVVRSWWFVVIPVLLGLDGALCWAAGRLGGRPGLLAWSICFTLASLLVGACATIAFLLPLVDASNQRQDEAARPPASVESGP